jgi:VanZ like protein/concanavalin A-like lectin/glucanase superfamily protein
MGHLNEVQAITPSTQMKSKLLGVLCFVVLCITLTLGLWPFHSPRNEVTWLKNANGLTFGKYGTVLGSDLLKAARLESEVDGSLEIWVQPDRWSGSATLLALYRPEKHLVFALRQSLTDLELQTEVENDRGVATRAHFYVDDAFGQALRQKKPVFVTVTAGQPGTRVYLDSAPVKVAPQFRIPEGAFAGRLIVGDSPRQPDSFRGQIRGLAIYGEELNGAQVARHYQTWMGSGRPAVAEDERMIGLYLFDEHAGNTIHNRTAEGEDLIIPDKYAVVDKIALEPFWKEFDLSGSYWKGNLKNIVGFLPAGFCFYAYLMIARLTKRVMLVAVVLGALVSLTIEILQAFLPTRDSGTTDLITNTLGTYVGALCYRHVYSFLVERFPWLGWFASPHSSY